MTLNILLHLNNLTLYDLSTFTLKIQRTVTVKKNDAASDPKSSLKTILVHFTPTIPITAPWLPLIGLSIQLKLIRQSPSASHRILVQIRPGTHNSEDAINRQLADKERAAAAGENENLRRVVAACLMGPPRSGIAL